MSRREFIASCAAAASAAALSGCVSRPRRDGLFWYNASTGLQIPCGVPWLYTAGNHYWHFEGDEGSDAEQRARWIEKRLLPLCKGEDPMAYAKKVGGVRFLMIDNSTYNVDGRQLEFRRAVDEADSLLAVLAGHYHRLEMVLDSGLLHATAPLAAVGEVLKVTNG